MVVKEVQVAGQHREEFFTQYLAPRHPLIIVASAVVIRAVDPGVGKLFL
jgi:hypothetical protein